jgi:hypothetical protein
MTITYTWEIGPFNLYPVKNELHNIIKEVHWRLTGTDYNTGYSSTIIGSEMLEEPDEASFTEFDSLTEEQVKQWILESMAKSTGKTPEQEEDELLSMIESRIQNKINPPMVLQPAPWG